MLSKQPYHCPVSFPSCLALRRVCSFDSHLNSVVSCPNFFHILCPKFFLTFHLTSFDSRMQRCPTFRIFCINVCPLLQKQSHHLLMSLGSRLMQRRSISLIFCINICSFLQKQSYHLLMT